MGASEIKHYKKTNSFFPKRHKKINLNIYTTVNQDNSQRRFHTEKNPKNIKFFCIIMTKRTPAIYFHFEAQIETIETRNVN